MRAEQTVPGGAGLEELGDGELAGTVGGSPIGRAVGWFFGYAVGMIANADPFDGNYYGVGA